MPRHPNSAPHFNDNELCKGLHAMLEPLLFGPEAQEVKESDHAVMGALQHLSLSLLEAHQERGAVARSRAFFACECLVAKILDMLSDGTNSALERAAGDAMVIARLPLAILTHHQECKRISCQLARGGRPSRAGMTAEQWQTAVRQAHPL